MSLSKSVWAGGVALLMGSMIYAADPKPAAPAGDAAAHHGHARLTKPWNEMKSLSEEEKTKIVAIHQKALDQVKEIEAKEHADIMATLTDAQKKEVADILGKDKEAARESRAHKPTTQPVKPAAK